MTKLSPCLPRQGIRSQIGLASFSSEMLFRVWQVLADLFFNFETSKLLIVCEKPFQDINNLSFRSWFSNKQLLLHNLRAWCCSDFTHAVSRKFLREYLQHIISLHHGYDDNITLTNTSTFISNLIYENVKILHNANSNTSNFPLFLEALYIKFLSPSLILVSKPAKSLSCFPNPF